ncbi:uncharacterized protein B0I36DRAFT_401700 [Microdochium trichocladiopsis]|uniref:Uncharacterized protein n=1 Tax=Microdochium trichocladiopsis TaxID=1682393 RepID=A0A9P9BF07_9PEZI|nr:uncharacterized protein B0I36DRAFT_401700 [Microdochium trichocladiopsis]KAH7009373.1 hypothetical protein B0I36DRAFT_401700 [Microdochium trichocladiopsis]
MPESGKSDIDVALSPAQLTDTSLRDVASPGSSGLVAAPAQPDQPHVTDWGKEINSGLPPRRHKYMSLFLAVACLMWAVPRLRTIVQSCTLLAVVLTDHDATKYRLYVHHTKRIVHRTNLHSRGNRRLTSASNYVPHDLSGLRAVQDEEDAAVGVLKRYDEPAILDEVWFSASGAIMEPHKVLQIHGRHRDFDNSADKVAAVNFSRPGYPSRLITVAFFTTGSTAATVAFRTTSSSVAMNHDDQHHREVNNML